MDTFIELRIRRHRDCPTIHYFILQQIQVLQLDNMPWDEEFDLMIIILKTLCTKCCKKGVKHAVPQDNIWILSFRFIWGIVSSLMCVITANKSKCDFFKDTSIDKDYMSSMLNMKMKDLRDLDVCDPASKFHNTSSPSKTILSSIYPEHSYAATGKITATLNGDIPFIFLTSLFFISAIFFLVLFVVVLFVICCKTKVGYAIIGFARYPYKFMAMGISVYVITYATITYDQVEQNTLAIVSLVWSCISLFFAIVMIIRYAYRTCCKKKKNKSYDVESHNVQPSDNIE